MVILSGYIEVPENKLENVLRLLPAHIKLSQQEQGCIEFSVQQGAINRTRFNVFERFVSQEAFEQHQKRTSESEWGHATQGLKRVYSIGTE